MKHRGGVKRRPTRLWLTGGLWLMAAAAWAGHGFMSSFGNIEWLPEPGETPDSAWYTFDSWEEESQLWRAGDAAGQTPLYLSFAREKLAEVEAMVEAENAAAAKVAADRYQDYMDRAGRLIAGLDPQAPDTQELAATAATALLEHQYILAIIYEELPAGSRGVVPFLLKTAQTQYTDLSRVLSRKTKGSLFFKEEEVRWNVQMVLRAEEEGRQDAPSEAER
ncbi:MAG: hypothetical protein J4F42_10220 [Desulfurellaceae bacterium]|nr:hypothetical protein [Desulfurellaceae bacterium]